MSGKIANFDSGSLGDAAKKCTKSSIFHLESFQGSLEFLLQLIQRKEVDLTELPLKQLVEQFSEETLEEGAEFIGGASFLLLLKSHLLLPQKEPPPVEEEPTLFTHLTDYLKMREYSQELERLEDKSTKLYEKGEIELTKTPPASLVLSLEELKSILENLLQKKSHTTIQQEYWQVSDKILSLQSLIKQGAFSFKELFQKSSCKEEAIALFLALLELIKRGEIIISNRLIYENS